MPVDARVYWIIYQFRNQYRLLESPTYQEAVERLTDLSLHRQVDRALHQLKVDLHHQEKSVRRRTTDSRIARRPATLQCHQAKLGQLRLTRLPPGLVLVLAPVQHSRLVELVCHLMSFHFHLVAAVALAVVHLQKDPHLMQRRASSPWERYQYLRSSLLQWHSYYKHIIWMVRHQSSIDTWLC